MRVGCWSPQARGRISRRGGYCMRRRWILLLVTLVLAQAGCRRSRQPALTRAAEYLWSQQSEDGGWDSHTYGLLRSGESLTGFVLEALLEVPTDVYQLPAAQL